MFGRLPGLALLALTLCTRTGVSIAQEEDLPEPAIPALTAPDPLPPPAKDVKKKATIPPGHAVAWAFAGGALAAATLGGVFHINERARDHDVERLVDMDLGGSGQTRDLERSRDRFNVLSLACFIGAGALAATSATLFAVSPDGFHLSTEVSF